MNETQLGHILVSEHNTWGGVLNLLSRPNKTSVNIYYDHEERKWVVGRVMSQIERDEAEDKAEQSSDDYA